MIKHTTRILLIITAMILAGCSAGNNGEYPVTPDVTGQVQDASTPSSQQLWGVWEIAIDPDTLDADIIPVREALFQANVTQFLQPPMSPVNLLSILIDPVESNMTEGYVVCDVTARHPFPGLAQYRGFDVRGIVMGDGSTDGESGNGEWWPSVDELRCVNADGYTRWWNSTEFTTYGTILGYTQGKLAPPVNVTGTVNAYKYFADGLDADADIEALNLDDRGTFSTYPGENTRRYNLQFVVEDGHPVFKFGYAITAAYKDPDDSDPAYPIESFNLSANMAEAFRIDVTDTGSSAYYESGSSFGGNLNLMIEVFDWGFSGTSTVTDEIAGITLESPTLFDGYVNIDPSTMVQGSTDYSYTVSTTIQDVIPTGIEDQEIMIRVLSTEPDTYEPDIPGIAGFAWPDVPLCAYYLYEAEISDSSGSTAPEVGVIDGPEALLEGESGVYTLSYATDAEDGTNLTILWDNDGDMDFDDDTDGDDSNLEATLDFTTAGEYQVIARAVDSSALYTDTEPFDVHVGYCPDTIHDTTVQTIVSGFYPGTMLRMDSGWLNSGDYAGQLIIPMTPTQIGRIDTSQSTPWTAIPFIDLENSSSTTIVYSLDVCDYSGRILIVGRFASQAAHIIYIYDDDGSYLGSVSIDSSRYIQAVDTDENGDIWLSSEYDDNNFTTADPTWIQHFEYQENAPYYVEDPADEISTSSLINYKNNVWDIAVSYSLDKLFIYHGNFGNSEGSQYGSVYSYSIGADGTLTENPSEHNYDVWPTQVVGAYMDYNGSCTYGKMDIDHADEVSDGCRIIVMARAATMSGAYFGVLDETLSLVDYNVVSTLGNWYYHFSISNNEDPSQQMAIFGGYTNNWIARANAPTGW